MNDQILERSKKAINLGLTWLVLTLERIAQERSNLAVSALQLIESINNAVCITHVQAAVRASKDWWQTEWFASQSTDCKTFQQWAAGVVSNRAATWWLNGKAGVNDQLQFVYASCLHDEEATIDAASRINRLARSYGLWINFGVEPEKTLWKSWEYEVWNALREDETRTRELWVTFAWFKLTLAKLADAEKNIFGRELAEKLAELVRANTVDELVRHILAVESIVDPMTLNWQNAERVVKAFESARSTQTDPFNQVVSALRTFALDDMPHSAAFTLDATDEANLGCVRATVAASLAFCRLDTHPDTSICRKARSGLMKDTMVFMLSGTPTLQRTPGTMAEIAAF